MGKSSNFAKKDIRMIWNQISKLALIVGFAGLMFGCTQEKSVSQEKREGQESRAAKDLSFGGIGIGEAFPESLKASFEYCSKQDIPTYGGRVTFSFPSEPESSVWVTAGIDPEGGDVIYIDVVLEAGDKAYDFYDMLKAKYGLPRSKYGDADCSLPILFGRMYGKMNNKRRRHRSNTEGEVLAEWKETGFSSDIVLTAYIPSVLRDGVVGPRELTPRPIPRNIHNIYIEDVERDTADISRRNESGSEARVIITIRYVNKRRLKGVERAAARKAAEARGEDYRRNYEGVMNQDF